MESRTYDPHRLRSEIQAAELTYAQIADALDVSVNYVKQLCSGRRQINERMARALAYTLDIEVSDLEPDRVPA